MSEMPKSKKHTLMLDSRSKLILTGAEDVNGFNEETVSVKTAGGTLIIKGEKLHIEKLSLETGDVSIDGRTAPSCQNYSDNRCYNWSLIFINSHLHFCVQYRLE